MSTGDALASAFVLFVGAIIFAALLATLVMALVDLFGVWGIVGPAVVVWFIGMVVILRDY